jgi:hypothetical protein
MGHLKTPNLQATTSAKPVFKILALIGENAANGAMIDLIYKVWISKAKNRSSEVGAENSLAEFSEFHC